MEFFKLQFSTVSFVLLIWKVLSTGQVKDYFLRIILAKFREAPNYKVDSLSSKKKKYPLQLA